MSDANDFQSAWSAHENAERFRRAMRDLETAPGVTAEECAEIAAGLLRMADGPDVTGEEDEDDGGQRYADKVNAPLPQETLEALRAELQSEEYARFRKPQRRKRES